ncbi:MAG: hypothetical protein Ct9H300mP8_02370 [Gammaproteobacteria bacterium]|nr:MAG: hypothetical protein Ct9H300mP8_02370 [Gammaproteobacteria bacterium]
MAARNYHRLGDECCAASYPVVVGIPVESLGVEEMLAGMSILMPMPSMPVWTRRWC